MCKGLGKSIIRDVTLKEGILHIKSNTAIYISPIKDSSKGIMLHNLITYSVWGNTIIEWGSVRLYTRSQDVDKDLELKLEPQNSVNIVALGIYSQYK